MARSNKAFLHHLLFYIGLVLELASLFVYFAADVAFMQPIIYPGYEPARRALEDLEKPPAVIKPADPGFAEVAQLAMESLSTCNDAGKLSRIHITEVQGGAAVLSFGKALRLQLILVVSDGQTISTTREELIEILNHHLQQRSLGWAFALLIIGAAIQVYGHHFASEPKEK